MRMGLRMGKNIIGERQFQLFGLSGHCGNTFVVSSVHQCNYQREDAIINRGNIAAPDIVGWGNLV